MKGLQATVGAAVLVALLQPAKAQAALPDPVRAMIEAAIATGDRAKVATVVEIARQTNPQDAAEIDALDAAFRERLAAADAAEKARKEEEIRAGVAALATGNQPVKFLTSCPSCLQGLARYSDDTNTEPDYLVIELAKKLLGENWMASYLAQVGNGGIERVLL